MAENTIQQSAPQSTEVTATEATREPERFVTPPVDIYETKEGLTVVADLPGAAPETIGIDVEDGVLTIKAPVAEEPPREAVYREFALVSYFRQFQLGEKIDQGAIRADARNGVLTLHLPFAEKAKPRRVAVATG